MKERIGHMFQLCLLWIYQHAHKSKKYKEAAGHIYRHVSQKRLLYKWYHMKTSCILRRIDDSKIWLVIRSKSEIQWTWCTDRKITFCTPNWYSCQGVWYIQWNMLKRNDTHNKGNYHKFFLNLERTMGPPALKIFELWWTAGIPTFLFPLPM